MPPKHALRGGNQSDDSFATSRTIFVASIIRCLFAAGGQQDWYHNNRQAYMSLVQLLSR